MDVRDLYREVILDHNRNPRNSGRLEPADAEALGHNPLCGDSLDLTLRLDGDTITEVRFRGEGCAISVASASLMTEAIRGKSIGEAEALFREVHALLTVADHPPSPSLGKLMALAGVREYPARVKCAALGWRTLQAALEQRAAGKAAAASITTE
jgi:nitrogen fixation NifU-like protein